MVHIVLLFNTYVMMKTVSFKEAELSTSARPFMLLNLTCLLQGGNCTLEFTLGRTIMMMLGYSTDELLVRAGDARPEWELGGGDLASNSPDPDPTLLQNVFGLQYMVREVDDFLFVGFAAAGVPSGASMDGLEHTADGRASAFRCDKRCGPQGVRGRRRRESRGHELLSGDAAQRGGEPSQKWTALKDHDPEIVRQWMKAKVDEAATFGLTVAGVKRLDKILQRREDNFRLEFGNNPPVLVAPLQVHLKPEATPTKASVRRFSPNDRAFLDRNTTALLTNSLVFLNHRGRWVSAPWIVRKKEQETDPSADPRMTVDTRSVKDRTDPMPFDDGVEARVRCARGVASVLCARLLPRLLATASPSDSQEYFAFITHRGMYTPTRVPMGATDSVAYCQGVVREIFGDSFGNGLIAWLDEDALLDLLDKVLERCEQFRLKLHAAKCSFFKTEVKCCGKMISADGVRHCPERVQGLVDMQPPQTAGELQQMLCVVNWMRQSIPWYNELTAGPYSIWKRP